MVLPLLIGAGIGALGGGVMSAVNDEPLWKGMLMGAGLGAMGGAGIGALGAGGAAGAAGAAGSAGGFGSAGAGLGAAGATGTLAPGAGASIASTLGPTGAGLMGSAAPTALGAGAGTLAPGAGASMASALGPTGASLMGGAGGAAAGGGGGGIGGLLSGNTGRMLAMGAPMALSMMGGPSGGKAPPKKKSGKAKRYNAEREQTGAAPDPSGRERRHFTQMRYTPYERGGLVRYEGGGDVAGGVGGTGYAYHNDPSVVGSAAWWSTQSGTTPTTTSPDTTNTGGTTGGGGVTSLPPRTIESFSARPPSYAPPQGANITRGPQMRPVFPYAPTTFAPKPAYSQPPFYGYAEGGPVEGGEMSAWDKFMMALYGSRPQGEGAPAPSDQHMRQMYGHQPRPETDQEAFERLKQEQVGYSHGGMVEHYQGGGIAALDQPTQAASPDQSIMTEAVMAIRGQHPTPEAAIRRFIQRFGPEAFEQLMQAQQQRSDGRSDSVPAVNPDGRAAALSEGEYVIPSDVVSGMGNGSTDSGGRVLDEMVQNVRGARTGQAAPPSEIDPMEMLPY